MDEREKLLAIIRDGILRRFGGYKFAPICLDIHAEVELARYDRSRMCSQCGSRLDDMDDANVLESTLWANSAK